MASVSKLWLGLGVPISALKLHEQKLYDKLCIIITHELNRIINSNAQLKVTVAAACEKLGADRVAELMTYLETAYTVGWTIYLCRKIAKNHADADDIYQLFITHVKHNHHSCEELARFWQDLEGFAAEMVEYVEKVAKSPSPGNGLLTRLFRIFFSVFGYGGK